MRRRLGAGDHPVAAAAIVAPWAILILGPGWMALVSRTHPGEAQTVLTVSLGVFFALLIARLVHQTKAQPARRGQLSLLTASVTLWASGSAVLNGSGTPNLTHFPSPGEWLFLAAYAGMAGFLLLDASKRTTAASATWLETTVICGGAVCLAGVVLVTPLAAYLGQDGLPLLLSLLYPLIDLVLAVLVIAQLLLGTRASLRASLGLLLGFGCFTVADAGFLIHLASGTYDYNIDSVDLWGAGFALLVGSACRVPDTAAPDRQRGSLTSLVVVAGMAAAVVLAIEPRGSLRAYLLVPALGTLTAAGARLALALRQANRTAEAILLSQSDELTGLPNRRALLHELDACCHEQRATGLALLDLDGFKDINDTLGHAAGDSVLAELGTRMRKALPSAVMLARLGGDEFALVVPGSDQLELLELVRRVVDVVRQPIHVDGIPLTVDASAGMTVRERDDASSELLRRADVAMYDAKRKRLGALLYDADSDTFSRERLRLGEELRRAIAEHRLHMCYQPQIEASTGRLYGLEALVRWNHPTSGPLNPAEFLPVARHLGLMQSLSEEVARLVVADMSGWRKAGLNPRVALNCAPPELMTGVFVERLCDLLAAASIPTERLVIEVTEDSFLNEPERARQQLQNVRSHGLGVSIDDYGTGFSSLAYLRDLPVQELKIDRTFVAAMATDRRSHMIVASTVQLATALELRTVAEGVEDVASAAELIALGVDALQGYHLSRPLPADRVIAYTKQMTVLIP